MTGKTLCIIPARGGSKRFPGKNMAFFHGVPLVGHAVKTARDSGAFDCVCVTSDDDAILETGKKFGADLARKRPANFADDKAQVKDVCAALLRDLQEEGVVYENFAVVLATSPLRTAEDISRACDIFRATDADFVVSTVSCGHPPQRALRQVDGNLVPFLGMEQMIQTQRLEPLYRHDGAIIVGSTKSFLEGGGFLRGRVLPCPMPKERSVDIDEPVDLKWAEFLSVNGSEKN